MTACPEAQVMANPFVLGKERSSCCYHNGHASSLRTVPQGIVRISDPYLRTKDSKTILRNVFPQLCGKSPGRADPIRPPERRLAEGTSVRCASDRTPDPLTSSETAQDPQRANTARRPGPRPSAVSGDSGTEGNGDSMSTIVRCLGSACGRGGLLW